jgi:phosphocarrier protein
MDDDLVRRQLCVTNPEGLHARPAAKLVQLANQFQCEITLVRGSQRHDAKSIMDLMTLAAEQGSKLLLEARGCDAHVAADAIEKLFVEGLGDLDANPDDA